MPELPDIALYVDRLRSHLLGRKVTCVRLSSPFLLRTYDPPLGEVEGRALEGVRHIGKRIALEFEGPLVLVLHLMIAGRLRLGPPGAVRFGELMCLEFGDEALFLTEVSKKKRASLHVLRSPKEASALDRGGMDPLAGSLEELRSLLTLENRTLKRFLTDPRRIAGIGNAYSDEILFWAELSPMARTQSLSDSEIERLFVAIRHTLRAWIRFLDETTGEQFPEKVTAFRPEMAVHGRYKEPCLVCGTRIARIVYAENEANYCPRCQTGGRLLADRALSRLLRKDWPKTIDEAEGG